MLSGRIIALARFVLAVSLGVALGAQAPAVQAPVFRGGTTLVQLDVVVTDADGKPVRGLDKSAFTVLDNGRERPVVAALEYHHDAPAGGLFRKDVASSAVERLVVIVVDDHSKFGEPLDRAKKAAADVIRSLAGRAHLALVRTNREPGVEFTPNAQELLDALDYDPTIHPPAPVRPMADWGLVQSLINKGNIKVANDPALEPVTRLEAERSPGRTMGGGPVPPIPDTLYHAFGDGLLSANDGRRKSFIVISEGQIYSRLMGPFIEDEVKRLDQGKLSEQQLVKELHERLQQVWQAASRTNSSVSIIDPRLSVAGRTIGGDGRSRLIRAGFDALAASTGGYAAIRNESFDTAIDRVVSELDHYYVLGFEPTDPKDRRARSVEVRLNSNLNVNRPGLVVRARTAFQLDETARTRAAAAAKKDPLLGLAYSPIPTAGLPLRIWATVLPPPLGSGSASSASGAGAALPIALWIDSGGRPLSEYAVFTLDMAKHREVGKPIGRKFSGAPPSVLPLEAPVLPPGAYQLRVAAHDASAGGSAYINITVPDLRNRALAILGLVIGRSFTNRADAAPLPFTPTMNRVFEPGVTLRVGFSVWRAAEGAVRATEDDVRATIQVLDANEAPVGSATQRTVLPNGPPVAEEIELPAKPGAYLLRVTARSGTFVATDEVGFEIRGG